MTINEGLFTSDKNYWETPQSYFEELNERFNFTLDAAASNENAKLSNYYTVEDNALIKKWGGECSVTLLMVERLKIGLRKLMKKV